MTVITTGISDRRLSIVSSGDATTRTDALIPICNRGHYCEIPQIRSLKSIPTLVSLSQRFSSYLALRRLIDFEVTEISSRRIVTI